MKTILYIVRHGQSKHNVLKLVQGGKNPKENTLSEQGRIQAFKLKEILDEIEFDVCYSSPIYRALETAKILLEKRKLRIIEEPLLREKNQGSYVGLSITEHTQAYKKWDEISEDERLDYKLAPNEESQRELRSRSTYILNKIAETNSNKIVLMVTHGGFMRSIYTFLENRNLKEKWKFENCGFMKLEHNGDLFKILETSGLKQVAKEKFTGIKDEEKK